MRFFILAAIIVAGLICFGWVYFESDNGSAGVFFNTDKAKRDTNEVIEKTKEIADDVQDEFGDAPEQPTGDE